jgi:redox-sensitive bicupin YhaK (pirin superfamily)
MTTKSKRVALIGRGSPSQVGDGFSVRRPIPTRYFPDISPFLMLDHAGPTVVEPSEYQRGVDAHPHKGFETVTIVYQGALEHRDSVGNKGKIFEGDVQWMTAASGIIHEEKHEKEFTRQGGTLEMLQLWVNLPAKDKKAPPGYQDVRKADIPVVPMGSNSQARVISGEWMGAKGPANTFTPVMLIDLRLSAGDQVQFDVPEGYNTLLYLLDGGIRIGDESAGEAEMVFFHSEGQRIELDVKENTRAMLLCGEPIREPVVSYGPFVMNTKEEIVEAIHQFQNMPPL